MTILDKQFHLEQLGIEVLPVTIVALNQIDLPLAWPFFHGLFTMNGDSNVAEVFKPNERVNLVGLREAGNFSCLVLGNARNQITGHPDIECSIGFACQNIDGILRSSNGRRWTIFLC